MSDCDYHLSNFMLLTSDCELNSALNISPKFKTSNSLNSLNRSNRSIDRSNSQSSLLNIFKSSDQIDLIETDLNETDLNETDLIETDPNRIVLNQIALNQTNSIRSDENQFNSNHSNLNQLNYRSNLLKRSIKIEKSLNLSTNNLNNQPNSDEVNKSPKSGELTKKNELTTDLSSVSNQLESIYLLNELGSHNYELTNLTNDSTSTNQATTSKTAINSTNNTTNNSTITNQDQLFKTMPTNEPDAFKLTYALLTKSKSNKGKL